MFVIFTVYRTLGILGIQSYRSDTKKGFKCRNKSYKRKFNLSTILILKIVRFLYVVLNPLFQIFKNIFNTNSIVSTNRNTL